MDGIFKVHHPISAWTLDDDLSLDRRAVAIDSFYFTKQTIASQTPSTSGGFASFTLANHGLHAEDIIQISGFKTEGYNGRFKVASTVGTDIFSIATATTGATGSSAIARRGIDAFELKSYNKVNYPGYALLTNPNSGTNVDKLQGKVPLSAGSSGARYGSTLIPSAGFLSSNGRYNQYTFETWVKIKRSNSSNIYKLIGLFNNNPATDDGNGLYYNNTSFILKIGNKTDSVFIKQINKPLLLQITYSETSASLYVNGEQLITLTLDPSDIALLKDSEQQYLSLQSATFDSIVLYPYKLTTEQAGLNYALGQATVPDQVTAKNYDGKSYHIDYVSSKYQTGFYYPKGTSWDTKIKENLNVDKYFLSNKEFELPTFNFQSNDGTATEFTLTDFYSTGSPIFNFSNTTYWSGICSNIEINNIDIFNEGMTGFYIDAYSTSTPSSTQRTLFKIIDKYTTNYLRVTIQTVSSSPTTIHVKYWLKMNGGVETEIVEARQENKFYLETASPSNKYHFLIGLDITKFKDVFKNKVGSLFSNLKNLTMFMLGDNNLNTYTTTDLTVNSFKMLTNYTKSKRSELINANGVFEYNSAAAGGNPFTAGTVNYEINNYVAPYELKLITNKLTYNSSHTYSSSGIVKQYFATGSYGYFKTDIPLKTMSKITKDNAGKDVESVDFVQFNIDYDAPIANISGNYFDTSSSNVKTYVTFEPTTVGNNPFLPDSQFTTISKLKIGRVVKPDTSWAATKYEIVDGTIIYMPPSIEIDKYTMVFHLEMPVSDTTNNTVKIKSFEFAPKTLNADGSQNPVGTKYSDAGDIIPYTYTLDGAGAKVYNYKAYNPFIIDKRTSPSLSLDRLSGIKLVGFENNTVGTFRGIQIPYNKSLSKTSQLNIIQLLLYYDAPIDVTQSNRECFQFDTQEIFNIVSKDKTMTATLTNTSGVTGTYNNTATLSIISNASGATANQDIQYLVNGQSTTNPTIKTNEWTMISIVFKKPLNFSEFAGSFNITGNIAFDNISLYNYPLSKLLQHSRNQIWEEVLNPAIGSSYTWQYWQSNKWSEVMYNLDQSLDSIDAYNLYGTFGKTNILYGGGNDPIKTNIFDTQLVYDIGYSTFTNTYSPL
jgi:hypothetical protein